MFAPTLLSEIVPLLWEMRFMTVFLTCSNFAFKGQGLSEAVLSMCDILIYIPQHWTGNSQLSSKISILIGTASLNVAVACSIILHHFALWAKYPHVLFTCLFLRVCNFYFLFATLWLIHLIITVFISARAPEKNMWLTIWSSFRGWTCQHQPTKV